MNKYQEKKNLSEFGLFPDFQVAYLASVEVPSLVFPF